VAVIIFKRPKTSEVQVQAILAKYSLFEGKRGRKGHKRLA
jgi:hypothetical protein